MAAVTKSAFPTYIVAGQGVYSDNDGGARRPRETQGPPSETPHEAPEDKPGKAGTSPEKQKGANVPAERWHLHMSGG